MLKLNFTNVQLFQAVKISAEENLQFLLVVLS